MKTLQINFDFSKPEIRIPGADFWSCNGLHAISEPAGLKATGWFQIHRPEDLPKEVESHLDWLYAPHDFPVYVNPETYGRTFMAKDYNFVPLPMVELNKLWTWPWPVGYSCTFSYQIALAIGLGYDVIDMRDVRLSDAREKALEAPNVLLWAGEAHALGIKVLLSDEYTFPFHYGQVERLTEIPYWATREVVNDLFPGWSRETRKLFHTYMRANRDWEKDHAERAAKTWADIRARNAPLDNS